MRMDKALFDEMKNALTAFEAAQFTFRELLDRLETCLDDLSDEDAPWKEAFRREWGQMEDAYAYASFKGSKTLDERDMPAVEFSLAEIKRLITEKISQYRP